MLCSLLDDTYITIANNANDSMMVNRAYVSRGKMTIPMLSHTLKQQDIELEKNEAYGTATNIPVETNDITTTSMHLYATIRVEGERNITHDDYVI